MHDLCEDIKPGVLPIKLLEVLSETTCGRYAKAPRSKFQMLENLNIFLSQVCISRLFSHVHVHTCL